MSLIFFFVLTIGGGLLIGIMIGPDEWYVKLSKPWFTPPNSVLGPVWTLLYVMIAVAGWRVFMQDPLGVPIAIWIIALALKLCLVTDFFSDCTVHSPHCL